jgi:ABC-2 type transport system ATP-binding protein
MNTLQISSLYKTYPNGVVAINNISLEISNGMFGLLGPNGAGKSSLMKTIAGLQSPSSGSILFNGKDVVKDSLFIKKQLGFLPQDFGVYPKISAYDLLMHLAVLKGLTNTKERKEQVNALLKKVNLYQHRKKEVHTFSGGMRQRFGIAQALLGNPQIVIVDEPTAGLDPEERHRFNSLLSEIGENIIIILSTHLVEDVKTLCTQMAVMNNGSLLAFGKPADFVNELGGKLWQKTIEKNEPVQLASPIQLISTQFNMGKKNLHVKSDRNPGEGFVAVSPGLEDAYFSILNSHA